MVFEFLKSLARSPGIKPAAPKFSSQTALAMAYLEGEGVERDPAEAVRILKEVIDIESDHDGSRRYEARYLGYLSMGNRGVDYNYLRAVDHLTHAFKSGVTSAALDLAKLFFRESIVRSLATILELAANRGLAEAQYMVALGYKSGEVFPKDEARYLKYLEAAAQNGYLQAQVDLEKRKRPGLTAKEAVMSLAEEGGLEAYHHLGLSYLAGDEGFEKSPAEAEKWLGLAASKGHHNAQFVLALAHQMKQIPGAHPGKGLNLCYAAAKGGHPAAQIVLAKLDLPEHPERAREWLDQAVKTDEVVSFEEAYSVRNQYRI